MLNITSVSAQTLLNFELEFYFLEIFNFIWILKFVFFRL